MKVSFYGFMAHDILEMSSWNIQLSESLVPWFHGPWNTLWQVFMENSWLMNLWSYEIRESLNKKLPFHGKFMARNKAMKFNFAVFMGHEMPFMGYSLKIHGIFLKNVVHSVQWTTLMKILAMCTVFAYKPKFEWIRILFAWLWINAPTNSYEITTLV